MALNRYAVAIPSFIFYISPSKSIDFTVFSTKIQKVCHHFVTKLFSSHEKIPVFTVLSAFSKISDALVKTFCILPHFYLFLYPGRFFLVLDSAGGGFFFCTARLSSFEQCYIHFSF